MIKGFNKRWTFRLAIDDYNTSILDTVVMAEDTEEAVNKAVRFIRRALSEYTPSFKKPEPAPVAPEFESAGQTPAEPTAPPEPEPPEPPSAPSQEKKPEGVKGRVRLYCPECGSTFGSFLKERQRNIACKCGHIIDLTVPLARYHFNCPYCKKETWGMTNLEDPSISLKCKCGCIVDMQWDPKAKEYRN